MTSPVVASLLSLTLKISTGPLSVPLKTSLHLSYSFRHRPKFLPPHFLWWFVLNSSYLLIAHGSPSLSYSNNIVDLWMYGSSSPPNCFQGCAQLGAFTWGGPFFTLCFLSFSWFFFSYYNSEHFAFQSFPQTVLCPLPLLSYSLFNAFVTRLASSSPFWQILKDVPVVKKTKSLLMTTALQTGADLHDHSTYLQAFHDRIEETSMSLPLTYSPV